MEKQSAFFMQEGHFRHDRYKWTAVTLIVLAVLVLVFLATLALTNHEELAKELLKDVVLLLGGGAGGYGLSVRKSAQSQQQPAPLPTAEEE